MPLTPPGHRGKFIPVPAFFPGTGVPPPPSAAPAHSAALREGAEGTLPAPPTAPQCPPLPERPARPVQTRGVSGGCKPCKVPGSTARGAEGGAGVITDVKLREACLLSAQAGSCSFQADRVEKFAFSLIDTIGTLKISVWVWVLPKAPDVNLG